MLIDADTHVREDYCLDEVYDLKGEFADRKPKLISDGDYSRRRYQHSLSPWPAAAEKGHAHKELYDPNRWEGRVARMQEESRDIDRRLQTFRDAGISQQVIFGTNMDPAVLNRGKFGAALATAYNNWLVKLAKSRGGEILPVAILPLGAPEAMAGELRRCVTELGFKAGLLGAYSLDHTLDEAVFDPLYAEAERLDVPLFVHPNSRGEMTNRFKNFYIMHTLARPTNCTAALVGLVIGGVFERFPKLRVAFFECNTEWLLYWMHRMDATYEYLKDLYAPYLTMKPSDYVRRNCWLTCEGHEPLGAALAEIGEDRLMMASDYPHWDAGFPFMIKEFRERTDLTARQKDLVMGENVRTLMQL